MSEKAEFPTFKAAIIELAIGKVTGTTETQASSSFLFEIKSSRFKFTSDPVNLSLDGSCKSKFRLLSPATGDLKHTLTIKLGLPTKSEKHKLGSAKLPSELLVQAKSGEFTLEISNLVVHVAYATTFIDLTTQFAHLETKTVSLYLENDNYLPGDTLRGAVAFVAPCAEDIIDSVTLELVSITKVEWKDDKMKYNNIFKSETVHYKQQVRLPLDAAVSTKSAYSDSLAPAYPGCFLWTFHVVIPFDTPATWNFRQCDCVFLVKVHAGDKETQDKKHAASKQLRIGAVPMPADPYNLTGFEYGEKEKILITTSVDPICTIGQPLKFNVEVKNRTSSSLQSLKVYLLRQNIFAGTVAADDGSQFASTREIRYYEPKQKLKLADKIQGPHWPLKAGESSTVQISIPIDPKLTPSVSRSRSWNAFRQYCLVVSVKTTDLLDKKKAYSATPIMFVHHVDIDEPARDDDDEHPPGSVDAILLGSAPVVASKKGTGLTLGTTPRSARRSATSINSEERFDIEVAPTTSFWKQVEEEVKDPKAMQPTKEEIIRERRRSVDLTGLRASRDGFSIKNPDDIREVKKARRRTMIAPVHEEN